MKYFSTLLIAALEMLWKPTASGAQTKKEVWVYASIYKEFIAPIEAEFENANPDINIQVFQAGSEKIQTKFEAELLAQKPQADLLLISDPFYAANLVNRGLANSKQESTNYYSAMVLIAHKDFPVAERPQSFKDLMNPKFSGLIQMGSPLESGSTFSTVAILDKRYGWQYFEELKKNKIASGGGNSSVIQKVESGEKKIGIVLIENALAAQKRGSPIEIITPTDGAVVIPSKQVLLKSAKHSSEALRFSNFLLSDRGQELLRQGFMYSVRKDVKAPEGAPSFSKIGKSPEEWSEPVVQKLSTQATTLKKKFTQTFFE